MKTALTLLIIMAVTTSWSQLIQWGPEITVADGNFYGNLRPRATIVDNDIPVVIFGKGAVDSNLFIARWNGTGFDTPLSILPATTSSYIANWTGPDIDSHGDTIVAVFKLLPLETGHVYSVRSTDGGITFSDTIRVDNHDSGVAWMPSMNMDDNGNPVVSYMIHDNIWDNPRYAVVNSTNAGISYLPEVEASNVAPGESCDCCPSEMVVDSQKQILLFRNNESNIRDMYGAISIDGGQSFGSAANVDNLAWSISTCPVTGADGFLKGDTLITAFTSAASGKYRVYLSSSNTSGGIAFESRTMIPEPDQANGSQNLPRISESGDTVVMVWRESVGGNQEIMCSISLPGIDPITGLTSFKEMANTTTAGVQTNPEVIYKNGLVHLFYEDDGSGNVIYRRGTVNTSLGDEELDIPVLVYPNPSDNGEFVLSKNVQVIGITTSDGRTVDHATHLVEGSLMLKIDHPSSRIYFLYYLSLDNQMKVHKLQLN